jgi:hypothetical protein
MKHFRDSFSKSPFGAFFKHDHCTGEATEYDVLHRCHFHPEKYQMTEKPTSKMFASGMLAREKFSLDRTRQLNFRQWMHAEECVRQRNI